MAIDALLWVLFAAAIAFITCGCKLTAPTTTKPTEAEPHGRGFGQSFDRAA